MDPISDDELAEIAARAEAATQAPWESFVESLDHLAGDNFIRTGDLDDDSSDMYVAHYWLDTKPVPAPPADLDLIAHPPAS